MTIESDFAQALRDPQRPGPTDLCSWNGSDPQGRFAIYRNNRVVSLVDALAEQFPVTLELVGDEFFRAMARAYVQHTTLRSAVIAFVGRGFAEFVAGFTPADALPYLPDVVRLEMDRVEACHAADAPTLGPQALATAMATPGELDRLHLQLHPSVHLQQSEFAVFSLWAAHQGAIDIAHVDPYLAQSVLVFRDGLDVATMPISEGTHHFLASLAQHANLARAATAGAALPQFDLPGTIALLLQHPLITHMEFTQ